MDSLASESSLRSLRRALDSLPDKIDETYRVAMQRIQSQDSARTKCANQVLSWVLFARRRISIGELRCALAVEEDDSYLDKSALPEVDYIFSTCGGLVVMDDSEIVRFIHFTAQDYFDRACHPELSSAQSYLATVCITYLSFSTFATGPCSDLIDEVPVRITKTSGWRNSPSRVGDLIRKRLDDNVLLRYVSVHWGNHVRECGNQDYVIHTRTLQLLKRKSNISCSIETRYFSPLAYGEFPGNFPRDFPRDVADLHVAAGFGLEFVVEESLQQGTDVDVRDSKGRTPLDWARAEGRVNIIKSLLRKGANYQIHSRGIGHARYKWAVLGKDYSLSIMDPSRVVQLIPLEF